MGIKNIIKQRSKDMVDITNERFSKAYDYTKLRSNKLKESIDLKIREKAILSTKARLAEHHKTFDDYSDEELDIIIEDEERKIISDLKNKTLVGALALLGVNFFI